MTQIKTSEEIIAYETVKSEFTDFVRFEGKNNRRQREKDAFINNREYTPNFDYPKLDYLIDDEKLVIQKHNIYEAVLELEAEKSHNRYSSEELELYAAFHEYRLKKIMLVEAARDLIDQSTSVEMEVNRRSFAELNEAVYGEFDTKSYLGMLNTEKNRLNDFVPNSQLASEIVDWLKNIYNKIKDNNDVETELLNPSELSALHEFVLNKYKDVLDAVPDTPDDVYYNIEECVQIINKSLAAGGLAELGWIAIENPDKTTPSTAGAKKIINLPSSTKRNANELRRLIIHEQEVHARRVQNSNAYDLNIVKTGTANYADAEEGLGVLMECAVAGNFDNDSFYRARDRYITAGLALGADGKPRDAREVYEILWRMIAVRSAKDGDLNAKQIKKAKNQAYSHIENAYRGTQFWMKGVIYTKLKVYYEGLAKNAGYFKDNFDNLDQAFDDALLFKYDHTDPDEKRMISKILSQKDAI